MILNSSNPFTRNGARKIAGLRKIRTMIAKIEPEFRLSMKGGDATCEAPRQSSHIQSTADAIIAGSAAPSVQPASGAAEILPGSPSLRLTRHQGELWVTHESVLLHKADAVDRGMLRHG